MNDEPEYDMAQDDYDESEPDPELLQALAERDVALKQRDEALASYAAWRESIRAQRAVWRMENPTHIRVIASDGEITRVPLATTEGPAPDYIGPTREGPDGKKEAIPDPVHERVHEVVRDVLAGRVLPRAREQLRDALGTPQPDSPTTASTSRPMPGRALGGIGAGYGLRVP